MLRPRLRGCSAGRTAGSNCCASPAFHSARAGTGRANVPLASLAAPLSDGHGFLETTREAAPMTFASRKMTLFPALAGAALLLATASPVRGEDAKTQQGASEQQ